MLIVTVGKRKKLKGEEDLPWEKISTEEIASMAATATLFDGSRVFVLENAIVSERGDDFLDLAKVFAESVHTFVMAEEKLLKAPREKFEKAGAKIEIAEKPASKDRGFDPFGLTFALGAKDKKKLWLGLTQALRAGEKAESIAGLLAWKARQMNDANLSRELTFMYHDSHRGAGDLELLLERFALKL